MNCVLNYLGLFGVKLSREKPISRGCLLAPAPHWDISYLILVWIRFCGHKNARVVIRGRDGHLWGFGGGMVGFYISPHQWVKGNLATHTHLGY